MKKSHLIGACCAAVFSVITLPSYAAPVLGQGTWETTLQARDFDANPATIEGYYDTVLGITWLADANANGAMTWDAANTWAAGLDFGPGIDNWRLPTMIDNGNDGCNYSNAGGTDCGYNVQTTSGSPPYPATTVYSEMASLFYDTLGNLAYYTPGTGTGPQAGWGLTNTGPFDALQSFYYWSGLEYAPNTGYAWVFYFGYGIQDSLSKSNNLYALAVHAGDVGAAIVPVPAAVWLFGSGLLALAGLGKQRRR